MKRNTAFGIVISIFLIASLVYGSFAYAGKPYYKEPPRGKDVPDNLVWNEDTGEYYDPNDYVWDTENQTYISKYLYDIKMSGVEGELVVNPETAWLAENVNTTDEIDKAVYEYVKAPLTPEKARRSYYLASEDDNLYILLRLGIKKLPKIFEKIKDNHPYDDWLIVTVEEMTGIGNQCFGGSEEGKKAWIEHMKTKNKEAGKKVKEAYEKMKESSKKEEIEVVEAELAEYGLLAVPYIMDQMEAGDDTLAQFLPELTYEYKQVEKEELKAKNKQYWKQWFKDNKEEIEILREAFIR